jgi:hypothetical protein
MTDKQSAIVIRFAVQDGQKVTEALKKLEAEGTAAFKRFGDGTSAPLKGVVLLQGAMAELSGIANTAAGSAGIVGSALSRLGPAGLAAGAAIGVVTVGLRNLLSVAVALKANSEASGLSLDVYQRIEKASIGAGANAEQVAQSLRQFAVQSRAAFKAQGDLYDSIREVNPELARQLATSKDQAAALKVVQQAMEQAGSAAQRAAIGNAAFGESWSKIFPGLQRQGSVSANQLIDPQLVKTAADVSRDIGTIVDTLKTRFFNVLKPFVDQLSLFLNALKEAEQRAPGQESPRNEVSGWRVRQGIANLTGGRVDLRDENDREMTSMEDTVRKRAELAKQLEKINQDLARSQASLEDATAQRLQAQRSGGNGNFEAAFADTARAESSTLQQRRDQIRKLIADLDEEERRLAERRDRRRNPPQASSAVPEITVRGRAAAPTQGELDEREKRNLYSELTPLQQRIAIMGEAATTTDRLRAATIQLRIAQLEKANIDGREVALVRSIAAARLDGERIAVRTTLGIATAEERLQLKQREVANQRAQGIIRSDEEAARVLSVYRKELEETVRQEAVRASRTPQLTRLRVEGTRDIREDIDQLAASGINEMSSGLVTLARNYKNAGQAATDFGISVLTMLSQLMLKRMILGPLAAALEGALGSWFGGGTGLSGTSAGGALVSSATGNVMTPRGAVPLQRFANGGVGGVARRRMFAEFGEGRQHEAYVPLPDNRTIPVTLDYRNTPAFNPTAPLPGGSGGGVTNNFTVTPPDGYEAKTEKTQNSTGGQDMRVVFKRLMQSEMADDVKNGGPMSKMFSGLMAQRKVR